MTVYTVTVPFAGQWLTANPKSTTDRWGRSRAVKDWRVSTVLACRAAKLPKGLTVPVSIHAVIHYTGRSPVRDSGNMYPTIKATTDGLTPERHWTRKGKPQVTPGYGLLTDDSDKQVVGGIPTWELKPTLLQPRIELTITEVEH